MDVVCQQNGAQINLIKLRSEMVGQCFGVGHGLGYLECSGQVKPLDDGTYGNSTRTFDAPRQKSTASQPGSTCKSSSSHSELRLLEGFIRNRMRERLLTETHTTILYNCVDCDFQLCASRGVPDHAIVSSRWDPNCIFQKFLLHEKRHQQGLPGQQQIP